MGAAAVQALTPAVFTSVWVVERELATAPAATMVRGSALALVTDMATAQAKE